MTPDPTVPEIADAVQDRMLAATGAALCAVSFTIDRWGRTLSALGVLAIFLAAPRPGWVLLAFGLVGVAGLGQAFLACRLAFDGPIFAAWRDDPSILAATRSFDAALVRCGLSAKRPGGRNLADRVRGTKRLLQAQAALLAAQVLTGLAGTLGFILTGVTR
jgi:hypothetical protein